MDFKNLKKSLKGFKENNAHEFNKMVKIVREVTPKDGTILDVGCGYGRYLKPLTEEYPSVIGVEANKHIVEELRKDNLKVFSIDEFQKEDMMVDTIIMSHIIEHFTPENLLNMMNSYLKHLKIGGHLIIATPTLTEQFYYDFDHIRPYYPQSIVEIFGGSNEQVQYYSPYTLNIQKVWFRRSRFQIWKSSWLFNNKTTKDICTAINLLFAILYRYSFSIIGRRSGWIGYFKKEA